MTTEELKKVDELRKQIATLDKKIELYNSYKPELSVSDSRFNDYEKCTILDYIEKAYMRAFEELKNRTNKVKCMKLKALASFIEECEKR